MEGNPSLTFHGPVLDHLNDKQFSTRPKPRLAQIACPMCGKIFSSRYIQQHADKCAARSDKSIRVVPSQPTTKQKERSSTKKIRRRRAHRAKISSTRKVSRQSIIQTGLDESYDINNHVILGLINSSASALNESKKDDTQTDEEIHDQNQIRTKRSIASSKQRTIRAQGEEISGSTRRVSERTIHPKPLKSKVLQAPKIPRSHGMKIQLSPDGSSETVSFRGTFSIKCEAIPDSQLVRIAALENKLRILPLEAVAISTSKGKIDQKKTLELQRRIQEEEYQLELYRSSKNTNFEDDESLVSSSIKRRPQKQQRISQQLASPLVKEQSKDKETVAFTVVPRENKASGDLIMRVKIVQDPEKKYSTSRKRGADISDDDDDGIITSGIGRGTSSPGNKLSLSKRGNVSGGMKCILDKNITSEDADLHTEKRPRLDPPPAANVYPSEAWNRQPAFCGPDLGLFSANGKLPPPPVQRRHTDRDALDYVDRMHKHHVPAQTIADFVSLLKAYKLKTIAADVVAERISVLLKDYPDLVADFHKFLPTSVINSRRSSSVRVSKGMKKEISSLKIPIASSPTQHQAIENTHIGAGKNVFKSPRLVATDQAFQLMGAYHPEKSLPRPMDRSEMQNMLQRPRVVDQHEQNIALNQKSTIGIDDELPSVCWRESMTDDEYDDAENGGFSDSDDDEANSIVRKRSIDSLFPQVDMHLQSKDNEIESNLIVSTISDIVQPENTLKNIKSPLAPNISVTPYHEKVNFTVAETLNDITAINKNHASEYHRDYQQMKSLTYKIWDRFKEDPYTFDAFATVILRATRVVAKGAAGTVLNTVHDRLRSLFGCDADDLLDELMISYGLNSLNFKSIAGK